MIYLIVLAISIGTFGVGYIFGLDKGCKNAHAKIVEQQLVRSKKDALKQYRSHTKTQQLRLIKGEITRE